MLTYEKILASIAMWEKIIAVYEGMENKVLIDTRYHLEGKYCAIGALVPDLAAAEPDQKEVIKVKRNLLDALEKRYGLNSWEAQKLQMINDDPSDWPSYKKYPNRYDRVLAYCKNQLAAAKFSQQSHSGYLTDPNRPR